MTGRGKKEGWEGEKEKIISFYFYGGRKGKRINPLTA